MPSTQKRKYELKARAERQRQTRERIVEATVSLHEEVGPARTTIADIARRVGVQRITVYKAFPDLGDLFAACQARFLAGNPQPDLDASSGANAETQLEAVLTKLYGWYRKTEAMERNVHRDRHLVPALDALMANSGDVRLDALADAHARALARGKASAATRALIRLALEFRTWELFAHQEMADRSIARVLVGAIGGGTRQLHRPSRHRPPRSDPSRKKP
jgi:AcrR family transcriptional regulator